MLTIPPEYWREAHAIEVRTKTAIWCLLDAPWLKTREQLVAGIKHEFEQRELSIQQLERKYELDG